MTTRKKQGKITQRDKRLMEEFTKLKNPRPLPLSQLKANETRKKSPSGS